MQENPLHRRAVRICEDARRIESELVEVLIEIDRTKMFRELGFSSLFQYCVKSLSLTESQAYAFISVARKMNESLRQALFEQSLSVHKASRFISVMTELNAPELIMFAKKHSSREIDFEVARINPRALKRDRIKPVSEHAIEINYTVSRAVFENLKKAHDVAGTSSFDALLEKLLNFYLENKDPVRRSKRILSKIRLRSKRPISDTTSRAENEHMPLSAQVKHEVHERDHGQCTFRSQNGERCESKRWLHIHHVVHREHGGSNELGNLTTLCANHHALVHQTSFPIEGQVSWLRSRRADYVA